MNSASKPEIKIEFVNDTIVGEDALFEPLQINHLPSDIPVSYGNDGSPFGGCRKINFTSPGMPSNTNYMIVAGSDRHGEPITEKIILSSGTVEGDIYFDKIDSITAYGPFPYQSPVSGGLSHKAIQIIGDGKEVKITTCSTVSGIIKDSFEASVSIHNGDETGPVKIGLDLNPTLNKTTNYKIPPRGVIFENGATISYKVKELKMINISYIGN